eukprot:c5349_g1_i3.p1 GENE.c5349_g1_i3~~c5349_g1_i3.p1  ORF type:complete len:394 (+),score=48.61 c5349_g1_i3:35-1216(+)
MANQTDPTARTVHGTNPQNLVEKIIRNRIYNYSYWKEHCFGLTAEGIVDKAMELDHLGGTYGGTRKPTKFLCLVLKMLQLQPDKEIVIEFIKNEEFKYVRLLGAYYLRLIGRPVDIYQYLEPLFNDFRKIRDRLTDGNYRVIHIDEFIESLLYDERVLDIALPRLPKRHVLEYSSVLEPRKSVLDDDDDEEEPPEAEKEETKNKSPRKRESEPSDDTRKSKRRSRSRSHSPSSKRSRNERERDREKDRDRSDRDRERDRDRESSRRRSRSRSRSRDRSSRRDRSRERDSRERRDRDNKSRDRSEKERESKGRTEKSKKKDKDTTFISRQTRSGFNPNFAIYFVLRYHRHRSPECLITAISRFKTAIDLLDVGLGVTTRTSSKLTDSRPREGTT